MNAKPVTQFQCPTCGEMHEWDDDTDDCCPAGVEKVTVWECGNCGTTYDDQDDARHCCWDGETDLEPYITTPAELEIAGQQRLPL